VREGHEVFFDATGGRSPCIYRRINGGNPAGKHLMLPVLSLWKLCIFLWK